MPQRLDYDVLKMLSHGNMIAEAIARLQLYLCNVFDIQSNSASGLQVLGCFSKANPIDTLVQTARKNSTVPHA
eukprot:565056-Hanusia_phi.AAC.1